MRDGKERYQMCPKHSYKFLSETEWVFLGVPLYSEFYMHHQGWRHRSRFRVFQGKVKNTIIVLWGTSMLASVDENNLLIFTTPENKKKREKEIREVDNPFAHTIEHIERRRP